MNANSRITKKTNIAIVYGLFLVAFLVSFYFIFKAKPSCQDGILNQNEERVDCGGPCFPCPERIEIQDLEISDVEWSLDANQNYDISGVINNPNELVGLENFDYRAIFSDETGTEFFTSPWEHGFVLPKEKKNLLLLGLPVEKAPKSIRIELNEDSFLWKKFSQYDEPNLFIINPRYEKSPETGNYQAVGTLVNKSTVDFEIIKIKVFVRDEKDQLLGINYQVINTVRASEQRDFVVFFPQVNSESVAKIEVEPETNVFSSDNFIRVYGKPERWDE